MRYLKVLIITLMCVNACTVMAASTHHVEGIIKSVDVENNTFTVELDKTGVTKTYSFPEEIKFVDNGVTLIDKSVFKPGQPVKLKLQSENNNSLNPALRTKKTYTIEGMIVE